VIQSYFSTGSIVKDPFALSSSGLRTDIVDKLRMRAEQEKAAINPEKSFGELLLKALDDVNTQQQDASALSQKLITDPNSVNIHDVTIAGAKATLSLSMTKEFVSRVIQAYKDIINIR
jgi:flagellar hook-basal body complex protein FliE